MASHLGRNIRAALQVESTNDIRRELLPLMVSVTKQKLLKLANAKNRNHCGTNAGWLVHRRSNEKVCSHCRLARQEYLAQQKAELRQTLGLGPRTPLTPRNIRKQLNITGSKKRWISLDSNEPAE